MLTPEVRAAIEARSGLDTAILVGIEVSHFIEATDIAHMATQSHVCVLQTTLELLADKMKVYVLADGVSSCNRQEVPIALDRLRHAGAIVTTSESLIFELVSEYLGLQ